MAEANGENSKPLPKARKNLMTMMHEFQLGKNVVNDLSREGRLAAIRSFDVIEKTNEHGLIARRDWKIKTEVEHIRSKINCHGGQKTSLLVKEPIQVVSSLMFIGTKFLMIGGGSPQTLKIADMDKIRLLKNRTETNDEKTGMKADQVKQGPNLEEALEDVTEILPKCFQRQNDWRGELTGVKGLKKNYADNMFACAGRNDKILAITKLENDSFEMPENDEAEDESSEDDEIWKTVHGNPANHSAVENFGKFRMKTSAGVMTRWAVGHGHRSRITDVLWTSNETLVSTGRDGMVMLWTMKPQKKEVRGSWPTHMVKLPHKNSSPVSSCSRINQGLCASVNPGTPLIGVSKLAGGRLLVCGEYGRISCLDGETAKGVKDWEFPRGEEVGYKSWLNWHGPKSITAQGANEENGRVIITGGDRVVVFDERLQDQNIMMSVMEEPTNIYRKLKNGPISAVCVKDELVILGHSSGSISFFDIRSKKMILETEGDGDKRVNWNLGPSAPSYADANEVALDFYPVNTIVQQGFKTAVGGGSVWNPRTFGSYNMGAISVFE